MSKSPPTTVFITITRSFLTRNILRSGVLQELLGRGFRVVVFFAAVEIPVSIRTEFAHERVEMHVVRLPPLSPLYRRFSKLKRFLIHTHTSQQSLIYDPKAPVYTTGGIVSAKSKASVRLRAELIFQRLLSWPRVLKRLFRFADRTLFPQRVPEIGAYFETYKPAAVFATSATAGFDHVFLKEARRRGVKTIMQPKGWDNVAKEFYPFSPNRFLAHNRISAEYARKTQRFGEKQVRTVGQAQFDWYAKPGIIRSRTEHLEKKGLDPARAVLFFGSEGVWSINDFRLANQMHEWIMKGELVRPCQLLLRPHFSNVKEDVFKGMRGKPHVVVDDYPIVDFLLDKWDPTVEDTIDFTNSVAHCDVMINIASTLSLDAACVDRPIITIAFGCEYVDGKDVTEDKLYSPDHIRWLMGTGGVAKARSFEELKELINAYLENPRLHAEGRARLRDELCYKVDGKSSERIADVIGSIIHGT